MDDLWAMLGALAAIVLPMAVAGWLLGRPSGHRVQPPPDPRGKMTGKEQG